MAIFHYMNIYIYIYIYSSSLVITSYFQEFQKSMHNTKIRPVFIDLLLLGVGSMTSIKKIFRSTVSSEKIGGKRDEFDNSVRKTQQ
jgi:hypothetical protein